MSFVNNPMLFNHILNSENLLDDVYDALRAMDMVGGVMSALNILRRTRTLPHIMNNEKSADLSDDFRNKGNCFFACEDFKGTYVCYNKALLYAPKGSIELVKAYSNRSALLIKLEAFSAALKDIETCFKLKCPGDLLKKLANRKLQCQMMLWKEGLKDSILRCPFSDQFFKFNKEKHPEIPCLSSDVQVVSENGETKALAVKDISIGTVLAIETAFTTYSYPDKSHSTCYYCQKMALNLFPCDNCCFALFCSKKCQELCMSEYHLIECQIMNVLVSVDDSYHFRLAVKTVLKLKTQLKQWSTLIKESQNIGADRFKTSSINETYDVKNCSSMLSFHKDRNFVHGALYNSLFVYATVIHYLQNINGFFPVEPRECVEAQKCLARLFTTLELLWPCMMEIDNAAEELSGSDLVTDFPSHYGWFAFTSKLKHFCEPNVIVLGLDNRVALVAIQPIKKMTELKISHIGHWYERIYEGKQRLLKLHQTTLKVCSCRVCKELWSCNNLMESNLTPLQRKTLRSWESLKENILAQREASYFKETCKALTVLQDKVQTKAHHAVFKELRVQFSLCQYAVTSNVVINC